MLFQTEIIENTTTWWSRARRKTYQRICRRWCRRPRLAWPRAERKRSRMVDRETKVRPSSCRDLSPFHRGDNPLRPSNSTSPFRRCRALPPTPDRLSSPISKPSDTTRAAAGAAQPPPTHAPSRAILIRVLSQPQAVSSLEADQSSTRRSGAMDPSVNEGQG